MPASAEGKASLESMQEMMPTRNLGKTGYRVGLFSLGGQATVEGADKEAVGQVAAEIRDEDVYCTKCIPQLDKPTSVRIKVVFWTALLWVPLGFVLGQLRVSLVSAAWGLATPLEATLLVVFWFLERGARKRGEVGTRGRGYFIAAPILFGLQWLVILGSAVVFIRAVVMARH